MIPDTVLHDTGLLIELREAVKSQNPIAPWVDDRVEGTQKQQTRSSNRTRHPRKTVTPGLLTGSHLARNRKTRCLPNTRSNF